MKRKEFVSYALLSAVAGLIFALSEYIQWYGDSYIYRFNFATGKPIESFWEILPSQYAHYFVMNGRVWAHVLCQGFSSLWGQTAFAVCNALVYVAFVLLFVKVAGGSWRNIPTLLLCILAILFFTDTSYIANCQIGYIWTSTATLAFIIFYFRAREKSHLIWWKLVLLFLLSFLAGNGNEAIAIGVGAALILDSYTHIRRLTSTQWIMLAGFGIGGLMLCLSPGTLKRASMDSPNAIWSAYRLLIYSRMLYVLVITLAILKCRHKIHLKKFIKGNLFFFIAIATLLVFNFLIGIGLSNRQLFGVEMFAGILTVRALKDIQIPKWLIAILSLLVIALYAMKFDYLRESNEDLRKVRKEIAQSEDWKVFVDFHRYTKLVHPTELDNTYRIYSFITTALIDDIVNFGHANIAWRDGVAPSHYEIGVYPTVIKKVLESEDRNFAVKCDDGMYLVVQDKKDPKLFFLKRAYSILGLKWEKVPYEIEFNNRYFQNMDDLNIVYSGFETPFVQNNEIRKL